MGSASAPVALTLALLVCTGCTDGAAWAADTGSSGSAFGTAAVVDGTGLPSGETLPVPRDDGGAIQVVSPNDGGVAPRVASPGDDPVAPYLALPAPDPEEADEILEELEEALRLWSDGEHREGARGVDAALSRLPALADWRPLVRAELLVPVGDTAGVRSALEELREVGEAGDELLARWGWEFLVQVHEEADDEEGARGAAQRAASSAWIGAAGPAAWLRVGRLALAAEDSAAAREALRRAVAAGGESSAQARAAARLLDEIAELESVEELMGVGRSLLAAGSWERARRRLVPLVEAGVLSERDEAELRLGLGRAFVELARPEDAETMLSPLTGEAAPVELAEPALYWSGRAALARDDAQRAEAHFLEVAKRVPGSPLAEDGLLLLLDRADSRGGPAHVHRVMDALLDVGVSSASGELAAVRFGTERYLSGDFDAAALTFERYLDGVGRAPSRQQAAYWAALTYDRRGETDRARELLAEAYAEDPLSFYGTFAADRLDAPLLPTDLATGPEPVSGIENALRNAILRLRVHQRIPTSGSFDFELGRLERHFLSRETAAYDLAEELLRSEFPIQSVVLGRTLHRRDGEWNLRLLRIVYPFPYRDAVVRESSARGLDPFFVAGLIRQESMFHPTIRSPAGAVGLMQILPSTAQDIGRAEGLRVTTAGLADPDVNLRLGTAFLASLVRRFGGRAEDALSAYNAGPTRARQWQRRDEYADSDVFLEHIPYRETRDYVKVVQQNQRIYTALYGCPGFQPCLGASYRAAVERSPVAGGAPSSTLAR